MKKIWIVGSLGHMGQALIKLLDMLEYELYETVAALAPEIIAEKKKNVQRCKRKRRFLFRTYIQDVRSSL